MLSLTSETHDAACEGHEYQNQLQVSKRGIRSNVATEWVYVYLYTEKDIKTFRTMPGFAMDNRYLP
ncbi:hypothetical protein HN011_007499 [Eciton burchellii]|nr:hypothetical protein HN011_007499 [Eciton burchellii]